MSKRHLKEMRSFDGTGHTMNDFQGYHAEWNLGCPGGWDYQRMAQERGKLCWNRIREHSGIEIELDLDHPLLHPVSSFSNMLLRSHDANFPHEKPFVLVVAEEDTLGQVTENINLVAYLNRMEGVEAALTSPESLEKRGDRVTSGGKKATVVFMDFNSDVLLRLGKKHDMEPLLTGIRNGIVVNPRGMEPVGAKGVFEAVTGDLRSFLSPITVNHTPWTRLFYPRKTEGPDGKPIPDLVEWVREHWGEVLLKPVHGYSGEGIFVGPHRQSRDEDIQCALAGEPYIVQSFIPKELWAEEYPQPDIQGEEVGLRQWQTDFRCFIDDTGLIGFLARFGGIPTNVGAGGGGQSVAVLKTRIPVKQAVDRINDAIVALGFSRVRQIQEEVDQKGLELGHTYLTGPTPTTLRPRIISRSQLDSLKKYGAYLWRDSLKLERMWREGALDHVVQLSDEEKEIARMQPWEGSPALIASDGLFSFGAHLRGA